MKTKLASAVLLLVAGTATAQQPAGLAGKWTLNKELSQNLGDRIKDSAGAAHMSGGPNWATEGTWLPWGADFSEPQRMSVREFLLASVAAFGVLEIVQKADEIQTIHGDSAVRNFYLTRKSAGTSALGGETVQRAALLEGQKLTLDSKGKESRFHETITLADSGNRLSYVLRLEQKLLKAPLEATLVYDRAR